jgi:hypothetical protein
MRACKSPRSALRSSSHAVIPKLRSRTAVFPDWFLISSGHHFSIIDRDTRAMSREMARSRILSHIYGLLGILRATRDDDRSAIRGGNLLRSKADTRQAEMSDAMRERTRDASRVILMNMLRISVFPFSFFSLCFLQFRGDKRRVLQLYPRKRGFTGNQSFSLPEWFPFPIRGAK